MKKLNDAVISEAILIIDISYQKKGQTINIVKGTKIYIDTKENIALINNDHVTIDNHEFKLVG